MVDNDAVMLSAYILNPDDSMSMSAAMMGFMRSSWTVIDTPHVRIEQKNDDFEIWVKDATTKA